MISSNKFVSYFQIEGKPILPPVMTNEKREEMIKYKEEAILIENNLKSKEAAKEEAGLSRTSKINILQRSPNQILNLHCSEAESESTIDNEYLRVSNLYRHPIVGSVSIPSRLSTSQLSLNQLQKSDTFIYDIVSNTLTNSCNYQDFTDVNRSISSSSLVSMMSNTTSTQNVNSSLANDIPTKDIDGMSNSTKLSEGNPLIRTKSYTLERPSTVLLQHINRQKTVARRKSNSTNEIAEYKAKKLLRVPIPTSASSGNVSALRSRKSPYETRVAKINRKKVLSSSNSKGNICLDPLRNIEETHQQKFLDLLKQQEIEQKALQKHFEFEQQMLMEKLSKVSIVKKKDLQPSKAFHKSHSDCSELQNKIPVRKVFKSFSP